MSSTPVAPPVTPGPPVRRVRHQARDAVAVMTFSAACSVGVAAVFLLLTVLGRQAG